jgi:hypothetical protein
MHLCLGGAGSALRPFSADSMQPLLCGDLFKQWCSISTTKEEPALRDLRGKSLLGLLRALPALLRLLQTLEVLVALLGRLLDFHQHLQHPQRSGEAGALGIPIRIHGAHVFRIQHKGTNGLDDGLVESPIFFGMPRDIRGDFFLCSLDDFTRRRGTGWVADAHGCGLVAFETGPLIYRLGCSQHCFAYR